MREGKERRREKRLMRRERIGEEEEGKGKSTIGGGERRRGLRVYREQLNIKAAILLCSEICRAFYFCKLLKLQ